MNKILHILFIGISAIIMLVACQSKPTKETLDAQTEKFIYKKYDLNIADKVKMGEATAKNTIVLAFDYSCPWCTKWMDEILPDIQKRYIDTGNATYVGQALVLLNEQSLTMAHADFSIEKNVPEKYYDLQTQFAKDAEKEEWGTDEYVQTILINNDIQIEVATSEQRDPIQMTRDFTKNHGVEFVPTLYVNGIKLYDPFNIEEIEMVLNGDIKENDILEVKKNE